MENNKKFLTLDESMVRDYKLSKYNLYLDEPRGLVYNTRTQVVASFDDKKIDIEDITELLESGFVVSKEVEELDIIKSEYDARELLVDELHLIIATTLDCNFRCFYCYEEHPKIYMNEDVKKSIVELVDKYASSGKNISVVWYGGEPMLDFDTILKLSHKFTEICDINRVKYKAAMISNGYLFDDNSISCLEDLHIETIQITVDGMPEVHEKRRPLDEKKESFNRIMENMINIDKTTSVQVHLRINVDKSNIDSAYELLEYCAKKNLTNMDVNLGLMKEFGCDHACGSSKHTLFTMREFAEEFVRFRDCAEKLGFSKAVEKMTPEYKVNSCTMDAPNAYVIDPHGYIYKCISLVGQKERSVGNVQNSFDDTAHSLYSPFENERCCGCKYFPICKGGCLLNNKGTTQECNIWKYITEKLVLREME